MRWEVLERNQQEQPDLRRSPSAQESPVVRHRRAESQWGRWWHGRRREEEDYVKATTRSKKGIAGAASHLVRAFAGCGRGLKQGSRGNGGGSTQQQQQRRNHIL